MTVHIDKVKPFLGEAPNDEPSSEQVCIESGEKELICEPEPEEESVPSTSVDYEVDSTRTLDRPRRKVQAPKYLHEYVRRISANEQRSDQKQQERTVCYCHVPNLHYGALGP